MWLRVIRNAPLPGGIEISFEYQGVTVGYEVSPDIR